MPVNKEAYENLSASFREKDVTLVAVSKIRPVSEILTLHQSGQLDFGENYVQELVDKQKQLPETVRWHFIGHLQTNKVKQIAAFVYLVHSVDSIRLLNEINKQAAKNNRCIDVLLQVHIAKEETKFGLDERELEEIISNYKEQAPANVRIRGLMGMGSFTSDTNEVAAEFKSLKLLFDITKASLNDPAFDVLSMGMSGDYEIAIENGSNMVRIGSLLFGFR